MLLAYTIVYQLSMYTFKYERLNNALYMENLGTMVKTLKISDSTHERLKKYGVFGDSFDKLLNRLMDLADGKTKK
jgi:hypothetical protein